MRSRDSVKSESHFKQSVDQSAHAYASLDLQSANERDLEMDPVKQLVWLHKPMPLFIYMEIEIEIETLGSVLKHMLLQRSSFSHI